MTKQKPPGIVPAAMARGSYRPALSNIKFDRKVRETPRVPASANTSAPTFRLEDNITAILENANDEFEKTSDAVLQKFGSGNTSLRQVTAGKLNVGWRSALHKAQGAGKAETEETEETEQTEERSVDCVHTVSCANHSVLFRFSPFLHCPQYRLRAMCCAGRQEKTGFSQCALDFYIPWDMLRTEQERRRTEGADKNKENTGKKKHFLMMQGVKDFMRVMPGKY